ncbi:MAG: hypothetical protein PHT76_08435 [Anaerostipes sp.]|nr:hypothetical protein [Anaerostipes sp.]
MIQYFNRRLLRQKTIYIALFTGMLISVCHIWKDVLPYVDKSYHHSPYTKWIESFSPSVFTSLLFMLMPILASMAISHIYREDSNRNYFSIVTSKGSKRSYFLCLYIYNFFIGGLVFILPILFNIYLCFLILPDRKIQFLLEETNNVTLYGNQTLFPVLYYEHPFLHMMIYVVIGFLVAGIFASIALVLSFYIKKYFMIWMLPFLACYIYETVICTIVQNGGRRYCPTSFCIQVDGGVNPRFLLCFLIIGILVPICVYVWSVIRNEIY